MASNRAVTRWCPASAAPAASPPTRWSRWWSSTCLIASSPGERAQIVLGEPGGRGRAPARVMICPPRSAAAMPLTPAAVLRAYRAKYDNRHRSRRIHAKHSALVARSLTHRPHKLATLPWLPGGGRRLLVQDMCTTLGEAAGEAVAVGAHEPLSASTNSSSASSIASSAADAAQVEHRHDVAQRRDRERPPLTTKQPGTRRTAPGRPHRMGRAPRAPCSTRCSTRPARRRPLGDVVRSRASRRRPRRGPL